MLCTPPAFILSQDQTLKQIVYLPPKWLDSVWAIYLSFFYFLELCYSLFLTDLYSHLLKFALYFYLLLFNCQVSIAHRLRESLSIIPQPFRFVKRFFKTFLSFFNLFFCGRFRFFAATHLLYHNSFRLSIGFWKFLKNFFKTFLNPSTHSSCCIFLPLSRQPQYSTTFSPLCQYFFAKFFEFVKNALKINKIQQINRPKHPTSH